MAPTFIRPLKKRIGKIVILAMAIFVGGLALYQYDVLNLGTLLRSRSLKTTNSDQNLSTIQLAFPMGAVSDKSPLTGHPFLSPSSDSLFATLLTDDTMHRSRGSGMVMLGEETPNSTEDDKWLFFWRESNVHTANNPDSVIKMGELNGNDSYKIQNIKTIEMDKDDRRNDIVGTDIRARLMGKLANGNSRIGLIGSRRDASKDDKAETEAPFFIYSDDNGESWTSNKLKESAQHACSPSFTFNTYPASAGGDDTNGFIFYCHGKSTASNSDDPKNSIYAISTRDNGENWTQKEIIKDMAGEAKTAEVSVVQIGTEKKWLMFGRNESRKNVIYKSEDMITWTGPYITNKKIGANSSTVVYNGADDGSGYITWVTRSSPYHYENDTSRAIPVDGKIFEGLVSVTRKASEVWESLTTVSRETEDWPITSQWPDWSILTYLPVHFDGTFSQDSKGNWYLLFGAIEGPLTPTGSPSDKTYSRLGIITSAQGREDSRGFLPAAQENILAEETVRSDSFGDFDVKGNGVRMSRDSSVHPYQYYASDKLLSLEKVGTTQVLNIKNETDKYQSIVTYFPGQTLPVGYKLQISLNFSGVNKTNTQSLRIGSFDSRGVRPDVGKKDPISNGAEKNSENGPWKNYVGSLMTFKPDTGGINLYRREAGEDSYLVNSVSADSYTELGGENTVNNGRALKPIPDGFQGLKKEDTYTMTLEFVNTGAGISQSMEIKSVTGPDIRFRSTFFDHDGSSRFDTLALGIPPSVQALKIQNLIIKTISPKPSFDALPPQDRLIFIGDSITAGWTKARIRTPLNTTSQEVVDPRGIWNKYFVPYHPLNLGVSGDTIQDVLTRIGTFKNGKGGELDGLDYSTKTVVLLIGTNSIDESVQNITEGIGKTISVIKERLPNAKIILLGILHRYDKKFIKDSNGNSTGELVNDRISTVNGKLDYCTNHSSEEKCKNFKNVKFISTDTVGGDSLADGLHPTVGGYEILAGLTKNAVDESMKSNNSN